MGLNYSTADFLARLRSSENRTFESVLTIGHLNLSVSVAQQQHLIAKYPYLHGAEPHKGPYADRFLQDLLGAKSVASLDVSNYEGCDIVHDLNRPIDARYCDAYELVLDGGSLEHVFDTPTALDNYASLVKPAGSIVIATVANNHMGHGFYQFSPELFFRYFSSANGFDLRSVVLVEHPYPSLDRSSRMRLFDVEDPAAIRARVGLVCSKPVLIMVHAVKTSSWRPRREPPIQSDYSVLHQQGRDADARTVSIRRRALRWMAKCMPKLANFAAGRMLLRQYSFQNRRAFKQR
jgi:hypothetical protein